ncbi:UNVERIFIED_CONTAM: hypothetical protein Sradi_2599400 [Sesamum radiatum]|uniref:Uncharacterized protein n=1 Tax=Sesamum radiatum TaxID=300843 RepID=A0AAW2S634_SESRA
MNGAAAGQHQDRGRRIGGSSSSGGATAGPALGSRSAVAAAAVARCAAAAAASGSTANGFFSSPSLPPLHRLSLLKSPRFAASIARARAHSM